MIRFVVWDKDMPKEASFVQDDDDCGPLETARLFVDNNDANDVALDCGSVMMAVDVTIKLLEPKGKGG
jgi:hypothetical protein